MKFHDKLQDQIEDEGKDDETSEDKDKEADEDKRRFILFANYSSFIFIPILVGLSYLIRDQPEIVVILMLIIVVEIIISLKSEAVYESFS